jgi:NADH dehydrogenase
MTRVVIIGAGYTGILGFQSLRSEASRLLRNGDVKVTVICPKSYHSFHGWTAEALTGIISVGNRQSNLRTVFGEQELIPGSAEHVDLTARVVTVRSKDGRTRAVPYDHLLLANGSYDNMEIIPGLVEYGYSVKVQGGVQATRNAILQALELAGAMPKGAARDRELTFVIAGGGFAGVEISTALAEMFEKARRRYPVLREQKPRVVLVHSGQQLIADLRPRYDRLADYCTKHLKRYGIDLKLAQRLTEVNAAGARLSNGELIPSSTVICTVGQRLTVFPGTEALPRTADGLLIADEYLRVKGHENVWTGGDAAQVMHVSGKPCPANALWAIKHGVWVGDNIARAIKNKPLRRFTYWGLGQAASVGVGKGAVELYTLQFTGWLGWILRLVFFLRFQPSRAQAARILLDWLTLPILGRHMIGSSEWSHHSELPKAQLDLAAGLRAELQRSSASTNR